MLRCIQDNNSVIDLTLSQIGLFIATAILLTVVLSLVFYNDWQRTAELHSLATSFSNLLGDIDNRFFENTIPYQFPQKDYTYLIRISTEYITLSAKGNWDTDLFVTERFLIRPWPRFSTQNWITGGDLHSYLNETCGHRGTKNDAIPKINFTELYTEQNKTMSFFALHPLEILGRELVYLEKVTIFYDDGKSHDFILVYQLT
jgi:hypothetical protein